MVEGTLGPRQGQGTPPASSAEGAKFRQAKEGLRPLRSSGKCAYMYAGSKLGGPSSGPRLGSDEIRACTAERLFVARRGTASRSALGFLPI